MEDNLTKAIEEAFARGKASWSGIGISVEAFAKHVRRSASSNSDLFANGTDLYLACGCAQADAVALRLFEMHVLTKIRAQLMGRGIEYGVVDEGLQQLRVQLLLGAPPGIAAYAGRAPLLNWLSVVAARRVADLGRAAAPDSRRLAYGLFDHLTSSVSDAELDVIRNRVGPVFQEALDQAIASLSAQAKEVVFLYYAEGLNIDDIGLRLGVHRATAARWLAASREAIALNMRQRLSTRLGATSSDFRSLTVALQSALAIDLNRLHPGG